jgi:hypothetical protein
MHIIDNAAQKASLHFYKKNEVEQQVVVDPATITLFATIIIDIIKIVKGCMEARKALKEAQNETPVAYRAVRRSVRRKLGWREWFKNRNKYVESVFYVAKNSTPEEMEQAYQEV